MAGFERGASSVGLTRRFAEPDHFASALLGGRFDYLPVREESFAATLRVLQVGDMVVQQADTSGHIVRGGIAPGIAVLIMNLQATQRPARVNGTEVAAAEAVLAMGGADLTGFNPQPLRWAALAVPLPLLEELAELAPPQARVQAALSVLTLQPDRMARLAGALSAAGEMAERLPAALDTPGCAAGLAMALREEVAAALTAEAEIRPRPRAVAEALRLVRAAEAFMEARLARPVYTVELSAALGVSARRLHDAFRAALGMSPHAYLKSRRLLLARRMLRGRGQGDGPELVKSVALDHGFWHLGHFARDYRALFGELPSETLASA
jgi:AraC family transcriptional regulator, ethanolamine operon transcriptional activator